MNENISIIESFVSSEIDDSRKKNLQRFQKKIGINFERIELLNIALTHSSYSRYYEKVFDDNEKLEFMGDAVLELASSTYIFRRFPMLKEGELTKLRASVVCQSTLAKIAKRLRLGNLILFDYGEESSGGRTRESNLEDAFEAVVGAIYLDCGWETARDFVFEQLAPEFENLTAENIVEQLPTVVQKNLLDYKSRLQELVKQHNHDSTIEYVEVSAEGPPHMPTFEHAVKIDGKILGKGKGKSKKLAEQAAAKKALSKLEKQYSEEQQSDG